MRPERPEGDPELGGRAPRRAEVQRVSEVVCARIPYGERGETPAPLDQAQHRGVVEVDARDLRTPRERGDEEARDAKAQEPIRVPAARSASGISDTGTTGGGT